jgi:hypothetical protein
VLGGIWLFVRLDVRESVSCRKLEVLYVPPRPNLCPGAHSSLSNNCLAANIIAPPSQCFRVSWLLLKTLRSCQSIALSLAHSR